MAWDMESPESKFCANILDFLRRGLSSVLCCKSLFGRELQIWCLVSRGKIWLAQ
jgi:hypothetical protein